MKNRIGFIILLVLSIHVLHAQQSQGVKIEGFLGVPVGDFSESTVFGLGFDVGYLFDLKGPVQLGIISGFHNYFGKTGNSPTPIVVSGSKNKDLSYVPIAASGRIYALDMLYIGADLGYALGLDKGNDGGFYYKPKVGFNFGLISTVISYSGISFDGASFGSVNLGFEIGF